MPRSLVNISNGARYDFEGVASDIPSLTVHLHTNWAAVAIACRFGHRCDTAVVPELASPILSSIASIQPSDTLFRDVLYGLSWRDLGCHIDLVYAELFIDWHRFVLGREKEQL